MARQKKKDGFLSRLWKRITGKDKGKRRRSSKKRPRFWWLDVRRWSTLGIWTAIALIILGYGFFFYYFFIGPDSFLWSPLYGDITYPDGFEVQGIDVSHYQKEINWEKLRNARINGAPVSFVMIKATEGADILDEYFNENFYEARESGIIRGAYHFFSTKSSGREQAEFFLRQVHLEKGDLPPVLDVETTGKLADAEIRHEVLDWLRIVEKRCGMRPIIYASYSFKTRYLGTAEFDRYPFWIAHYYVEKVKYKGAWKFWQYTDRGKVDGIRGHVDLDICNGTYYDLQSLTKGFDGPPEMRDRPANTEIRHMSEDDFQELPIH